MSFIIQEILSKCFGIDHYEIKKVTKESKEKKLLLTLERTTACFCSKCGAIGGRYDSSVRDFIIGTLNTSTIVGRARIHRIRCPFHGIITEQHGISEGKKRYSKTVGEAVIQFTEKLDNRATSKLFGVSEATIYRIDYNELSKLQTLYLKALPAAKDLSVDEVSYKRRHRYASVISSHEASKVLWLEKGRKQSDLERGYCQMKCKIDPLMKSNFDPPPT